MSGQMKVLSVKFLYGSTFCLVIFACMGKINSNVQCKFRLLVLLYWDRGIYQDMDIFLAKNGLCLEQK